MSFSHFSTFSKTGKSAYQVGLAALSLSAVLFLIAIPAAWSDSASVTSTTNAQVAHDVGNAVNGSANGSNLNSQSINLQTGGNANTNTNQIITPTQALSNGGSSALVLPRNPLTLGNAGLGRSNFGLQFGVNNNPGFGSMFGNGAGNALGWFMQGGVTVPFGKIPDIIAHPQNTQLDDTRAQRLEDDRHVFGSVQPQNNAPVAQANVQGRVVSLNAYNYATVASPKVGIQNALQEADTLRNAAVPKVLALADGVVFSKPLGKGAQIGTVQAGEEYRYIAHIQEGWVKIILSNGSTGWAKDKFEYLKNDYTEIDTVTLHNTPADTASAHAALLNKLQLSDLNAHKKTPQ